MADDAYINASLNSGGGPGAATAHRPDAFGRSGAFRATARNQGATQPMSEAEFARAVGRLNKALNAPQPLRTDVPRGFYLNIRV